MVNILAMGMLAALVNPLLFWGGAAAVAAPIIIHLLARRRFRRIRWAAMEFLIDAEKRNRRRVRLEEMILLALRCLAIILIALLVARPFVRPTGVAAILGGTERTERIFLVDDSFSMGYDTGGSTSFSRAKESLLNLLNRLREHAPQDTVTILTSSQLDSPLAAGALLDERQLELIRARIEALASSQTRLSTDACIGALAELLTRDSSAVSAAIYVISDFQRNNWVDRARASGAAGALAEPLKAWADSDRALRMILVDVGDDDAQNLAVTQLEPARRQVVAGVEVPIRVTLSNHMASNVDAVDLQVAVGQVPAATARVDRLFAGGTATAEIPVIFPVAGDDVVRIELPPDNLPTDNVRSLAVEVTDSVRVLLVNGEQSADTYSDEVHLLATALRPEGSVFSGNTITIITDSDLDATDFSGYHLVVLANVYRVSEPAADALHRFVFDGGGLAIFLGDQVSDPLLYNATLYREGRGLLPASLQAIISAPGDGVTLSGSDFLHPVVRVFSGADNPFVQRIRFQQYYAAEPAVVDEDAAPAENDAPAPAYRPSTNVIARFDDVDQTPAILERPYGRGRVMQFASSCDLEWNDWARDPSYVVAMLEIAQYLARSASAQRSSLVGEPISLPLDAAAFEPGAVVRPPGYPQEQEVEVTAVAADDGTLQIDWPHTQRAGVYTFILRRRDGGETLRRHAVGLDADESDLAPADADELRDVLDGISVEYVAGVAPAEDEGDEGRRELWPAFLVAAMSVLMIEQLLAWRFGRRGL